jgi:hypothetical protein
MEDWVTARANCSVLKMFLRLQVGVRKDVEIRNGLRRSGDYYAFDIVESDDQLTVSCQKDTVQKSVRFIRGPLEITVVDEDGKQSHATVMLDSNRACLLVVDGTPMDESHFRQRALERLLFTDWPSTRA